MNFDLLIIPYPNKYHVRVVSSPTGETEGSFTLPFTQRELDQLAWRPGGNYRHLRPVEESDESQAPCSPMEFGIRLFRAVFADKIGESLRRSLDEARRQNEHLRVRLRLKDVPELAILPWEYLFDPERGQFFALLDQISLMRYMEIPEFVQPLQVELPLRILVMVSKPFDARPLAVEQEWYQLQQALHNLIDQGKVVIEKLEAATGTHLQRQLRRNDYHIFHFIGHGWFDEHAETSGLLLEDDQGRGMQVTAQQLGVLLQGHRTLRFAFLNACQGAKALSSAAFTGTVQHLVQLGLPAAVAMQFPVSDNIAIRLSQEFYQALADNYPVDRAVTEARKAVFAVANSEEWATPVLFMRTDDGQIYEIPNSSTPEPLNQQIQIQHRTHIEGNVDTGGGDFVGRDKIIHIHQYGPQRSIPEPPEPDLLPERMEFVGRDDALKLLIKNLTDRNRAVLSGMPGIGKTALAHWSQVKVVDEKTNRKSTGKNCAKRQPRLGCLDGKESKFGSTYSFKSGCAKSKAAVGSAG